MSQISVKFKLIIALSLILVVSFVLTSVVNYRVSREAVRHEIMTSSLPLTIKNIYSEIHSDLIKPINVASLMANDTFLIDWTLDGEKDPTAVVEYLDRIHKKYGFFAAFFVSTTTENYYYPDGILKKIHSNDPHDIWFYDFVDSGQEYDLDVDTNEAAQNNLTIFINFRMENAEGELLGVTGVGLEMDRVAKLLKRYQRRFDRTIYLVDPTGLVQVHSDKKFVESATLATWDGLAPLAKDILTPRAEPKQYEYDREGHHILLSVRYIPEFNWFLLVEQDETSALGSARANLIRTLLMGLGASIIILFLCILTVNHYQSRLEHQAATDELTGVKNRREFANQFERAAHRAERHMIPFSLVLFDIDGLKEVNDTLGHLVGDNVITGVSDLIMQTVRTNDVAARWGGDEFIVLIEGDVSQAVAAAERIRAAVVEAKLPETEENWQGTAVTISCGVAQYRKGDDLDSVTLRSDQTMYKAKRSGKNKVECHQWEDC